YDQHVARADAPALLTARRPGRSDRWELHHLAAEQPPEVVVERPPQDGVGPIGRPQAIGLVRPQRRPVAEVAIEADLGARAVRELAQQPPGQGRLPRGRPACDGDEDGPHVARDCNGSPYTRSRETAPRSEAGRARRRSGRARPTALPGDAGLRVGLPPAPARLRAYVELAEGAAGYAGGALRCARRRADPRGAGRRWADREGAARARTARGAAARRAAGRAAAPLQFGRVGADDLPGRTRPAHGLRLLAGGVRDGVRVLCDWAVRLRARPQRRRDRGPGPPLRAARPPDRRPGCPTHQPGVHGAGRAIHELRERLAGGRAADRAGGVRPRRAPHHAVDRRRGPGDPRARPPTAAGEPGRV